MTPRTGRALFLGTAAVGVLDGLDAVIFFGLRGVPGPIPLSASPGGGPKPTATLINGLLIHVFGVGIPAVLAARSAVRPRRD